MKNGVPPRMDPLPVGAVIERGDVFLDDGKHLEMDRLGRLLGVRCLGETIKKSGSWFRRSADTEQGQAAL